MNIADRNMQGIYKYIDWEKIKESRERYIEKSDLRQYIAEHYPNLLIYSLDELKK